MPRAPARAASLACALLMAACAIDPAAPVPTPVPAPAPPAPPPVAPPVPRYALPVRLADARQRCAALTDVAPPGFSVARADLIDDGSALALDGATGLVGTEALPAHCRLNGRIDGVGPRPIEFEMRLPSDWNGRFFQQGRDAELPYVVEAFGRNAGAAGVEDNALSRGFAVLSSDAGLADPTAPSGPAQVRMDADRALERAALAAKALIEAYYGKPPDRSYFVGCSAGGRDGLLFAQRWPAIFDGIVAVAPTLRETEAALAGVWAVQRLESVAPRTRQRQRVLSRAFSVEEMFTVARSVLAQCDALDGAEDGFVMDMAGCRVDLAAMTCARGDRKRTDCLPAPKARALADAMAGPRDPAGAPLYAPWPWDPGLAAPAWRAWNLGQAGPGAGPDARQAMRAAAVLGRVLADAPAAKVGVLRFDFARDLAHVQAARQAEATFATAPLDAFRARDGRLLLMHGAADPVVSAWATVEYQRAQSAARDGAAASQPDEHVRTFIVPGMNHCRGGPATDRFDALATMVEWVEYARAPQRIEARGSAVLRDESRPLCPWPLVARYRGEGPISASASHACR